MAKKGHNTSVRDDLFAYLLGKRHGQILPSEYTQVEYIKSTGTQYIDTNYFANPNSSYELTLKFDNPKSDSEWSTSHIGFINSTDYENNTRNISINFGGQPKEKQVLYIWRIMNQEVNKNIVRDIILNKNVMSIKGTSFSYGQYTNTIPNSNDTVLQPLLLFAGRLSASVNTPIIFNSYDMYVYDFKIYENDILVKHYIPCYRNNDNEVGLYDIVNNVFYTNQGTGNFLYE
jgi:hypothetical protein